MHVVTEYCPLITGYFRTFQPIHLLQQQTLTKERKDMRLRNSLLAALLVLTALPALAAKEVLPWIENDYSRAVSRARTAGVPIFAETWAPW
jgi:hypothetical protein